MTKQTTDEYVFTVPKLKAKWKSVPKVDHVKKLHGASLLQILHVQQQTTCGEYITS